MMAKRRLLVICQGLTLVLALALALWAAIPAGTDTPVALASLPAGQVLAPDGSGTMAESPASVPTRSSQSLTFTYTAAAGGIQLGTVDLAVPSAWPAPQLGGSTAAVTTSLGPSDSALDQMGTASIQPGGIVQLIGVTLAAGDTLLISYGNVTVPSPGSYTFTTSESSTGASPLALGTQPQVTVTPVVPGAPNLIATVAGSSLVEVVWEPPAADGGAPISAYDVFRSTTPGSQGSQIATVAPGSSPISYIDRTVTNGATYYYDVAAVNRAGQGPASSQFVAQPQHSLPPPLLATTIRIRGQWVTFSSSNRCIRGGRVTGRLAVSSLRQRPKLLIARAVFRVGKLVTKTVTRRQPSGAAMPVMLRARRMVTRRRYRFVAQPWIVVGRGRAYRHTLRLAITAC